MLKKANIIKICILLVLLAGLTALYARQDIEITAALSEETIVRNGQYLNISLISDNGQQITVQAETPYYSIYEYNAKIPPKLWNASSQVRLEFGGVRKGDHIYLEYISVEHPVTGRKVIDGEEVYEDLRDISSAGIGITGDGLIDITVLATRAHTETMSTEGPSFSLSPIAVNAWGIPETAFVSGVLAVIVLWALAAFIVPVKAYIQLAAKLRGVFGIIRQLSIMDITIALLGISGFVFYCFGDELVSSKYENISYRILFSAAILLIFIKIISNKQTAAGDAAVRETGGNGAANRIPYVLILIAGLLVYVPALFPNPYFNNDEYQVIEAAEWFLLHGSFDIYNRAWPHTLLVAVTIKLFGLSVTSLRAVSAVFGIIFIVSAYHIVKSMTRRKDVTFLSIVLLLFNPALIEIFTTIRMYAMVLPVSLWLFYCLYKTLHCGIAFKKDNAVTRFIKTHIDFHFGYAAAAFCLMYFIYLIHINALILLLCTAVYVFILTVLKRQRKYIILSVSGIGLIVLSAAIYYFDLYGPFDIPVIPPLIESIKLHSGFGWYNYDYFWAGISMPFGPYFGILFLSAAVVLYITGKCGRYGNILHERYEYSSLFFSMICCMVTVIFFVFFADRYYSFVYMAFLVPVIVMIISTGICAVKAWIPGPTRISVYLIIAAAIASQMVLEYQRFYVDNPDRAGFDRPYQIMANDAKIEELLTVPQYSTFSRSYFTDIVPGGHNIGNVRAVDGSGAPIHQYQIDRLLERIDLAEPVVYFFSEQDKMWHVTAAYRDFLITATDFITDIDSAVIYKHHFIEAVRVDDDPAGKAPGGTAGITDVLWDGDAAYLRCEMSFIPELYGAVFVAVEVTEQGIAQAAAHRYQVLIPDGTGYPDTLAFTLPVRPKTEEYTENIAFSFTGQVYVYYGLDVSEIIEIN